MLTLGSGGETGKNQIRASVPQELGGRHADLTIQVKK